MRPRFQAQAVREFDIQCHAYLRDESGPLSAVAPVEVEASPYRGGEVVESWPATLSEAGRLDWVVPSGTKLLSGLYQLHARAGDQLLGVGLLEVV